ncbi:MAG: hypothetical protein LRY47_03530, partial [Seleniivibrio sp.]
MKDVLLKKELFGGFVEALMNSYKVAAPTRRGDKSFAFDFITDPAEVCLDHIPTILPPKKYFLPQHETLLEYDTTEGQNMQAFVEI